jgi:hypothetical protein
VGRLVLEGGDDADKAQWMDLHGKVDLFASHSDFLHSVAESLHASLKYF